MLQFKVTFIILSHFRLQFWLTADRIVYKFSAVVIDSYNSLFLTQDSFFVHSKSAVLTIATGRLNVCIKKLLFEHNDPPMKGKFKYSISHKIFVVNIKLLQCS